MSDRAARVRLSISGLHAAVAVAAAVLVVVLWFVPRDVTFEATVASRSVTFEYDGSTDTLFAASPTRLEISDFQSIDFAPGTLRSVGSTEGKAFANGLRVTAANESSALVIDGAVRLSEIELPRRAVVRLEPQSSAQGTVLSLLLHPPDPNINRSGGGCPVRADERAGGFSGTLKFPDKLVRLHCSGCAIEGMSAATADGHFEYRIGDDQVSTAIIEGRSDALRLLMSLPDSALQRPVADRTEMCSLRLDDGGSPPDSTVIGGELFSAAIKDGKQEIRTGNTFEVEPTKPMTLRDLAIKDGNLNIRVSGQARRVTLADTTVTRSLIDELMNSRVYAVVSLAIVFALAMLRIVDALRIKTSNEAAE